MEPSGAFTLSLTGGEWHIGAEPLNPPAPWIFPGPPAWIVFADDATPQSEAVTLEVIPTNAEVNGRIVCPGPAPCPAAPGEAFWQDIVIELRNDEIRNDAGLGPDYGFHIPVPDGWYELVVHLSHGEVQGPEPVPVFVGPEQSLDAGDIELLLKDAAIAGRVRDKLGNPVEGVPVAGWQPEGVGWGRAETNASGVYTMPVIGGDWFVEPQPGPELPYVFRGAPSLVSVAPGGTMSGVDFTLASAEARIEGIAVDANTSERIWGLEGWAFAELGPEFFTDAPMSDGAFELKVEGGRSYIIGVDLPPHAPYVSGGTGPVAVGVGAAVPIVLPLEPKDAAIEGHLVDGLTGLPPTEPVWAEVFGEDAEGHWVAVDVDPAISEYRLEVISGTWELRAWVDVESGYVAVPATTLVTVQSGQTVPQDFEVWPVRSTISGQVLKPDGTPVDAYVFAEGDSPFVGHFEVSTWSDTSGNFELLVPEGAYVVGAGLPGDELETLGWLNPTPVDVPWVSAGSPVTGLELRFLQLDGVINGTVSFAGGISVTPTHAAYVWGWAESGEWAETEAALIAGTSTFTYSMRVVSDTIWHVGAVYEDWDNGVFYESPERLAPVPPSTGQVTRNLDLGGPWPLPQPFIISFDGTQMQTIIMPDGVELSIPPGSLVVSGTVTLFVFPTQELRPEPGQEIVGAGYEIWAIDQSGQEITQFNKNVVMTFHYPTDAALAAQGVSETLLVPVYYSTLVGNWILADSYIVDTANNEIVLQIGHFTTFGLMSTEAADNRMYLPLVLRD